MAMMKYRWMAITLADGRLLKFKFPVQVNDENVAARIEELLKMPSVTISTGETLFVIPTAAIQTIAVTPAPAKLPKTAIRGATLG